MMKGSTRRVGILALSALALVADSGNSVGASPIYLRGVVEPHCSIVVSALPVESILPIVVTGQQRIVVGTILKNCNQKTGLTLTAAFAVCATIPARATIGDTTPLGALSYSRESDDWDGLVGSARGSDLAAASCSTAVESALVDERNADGTSTLYVNFYMN
jgi:hypothetical protein